MGRWGPRHRKTRAVLIPLGLNLAALGFLGAILVVGGEPGGLTVRWLGLAEVSGAWALVSLPTFRFPRSLGLPLVVLIAASTWLTLGALKEFAPWGPSVVMPSAQPLTDRELVTSFAVRVDTITLPVAVPGVPRQLVRWREGNAVPPEWWWSWAQAQGWARSEGAAMPEYPMKFGVYHLELTPGGPFWRLEKPDLAAP